MIEIEDIVAKMHLEDLLNEAHPSVFFNEHSEYDMLILRFPVIGEELVNVSLGFVVTKESSYLYDRSQKVFVKLDNKFQGPYQVIDRMLDELLKDFNQYHERIADMEESLYSDSSGPDFMTHWLGLKRDIVRIERIMLRSSTVLKSMISHFENDDQFPIHHYTDIHEHSERILRSSTLQLSKLDYLYNFYNTRTNEKMNRLILLLTILSAIVLPLNLIVGFFGMNTTDLPFTKEGSGTGSVIVIMTSILVVTSTILYLWEKKRTN